MRLAALALLAIPALAQTPPPAHVFVRVTLAASAPAPVSGRLLVFLKQGTGDTEVNTEEFAPAATWVAAREVHDLLPGASVEVDGTDLAFPASFATMPAGTWEAQAVLDPDHTYNYSGRGPGDWTSPVLPLPNWSPAGPEPALTLDQHPAANPGLTAALAHARSEATPNVAEPQLFSSPALTRFWGAPTQIKAWIILPPGYAEHPTERYPTAYWTHGFGGNLDGALLDGLAIRRRMLAGTMPPMIWVMLDESCPQGTHEFADSVNNGPWGTALTTEFIPWLEQRYRMDAKPTGRLLNGHSSGGWATLQLQVNYPQIFGGTWSTSPDPSDFHNFTGPDLYAAHANLYRDPAGQPYPIMRSQGKVIATLEQFARLEHVLGPIGGQINSFDWVFSPRSALGSPTPLFDTQTGAIDPAVVAYWHDHYDLANMVERTWPQRGPLLKGRIHLFVGTADTFYLDGAAHLFEARLQRLGADPHFTYLPNKTHFDLYNVGPRRNALFDQIGAEMYAVARPGVAWKQAIGIGKER
jgi:enterochelin esterase-like enzyme